MTNQPRLFFNDVALSVSLLLSIAIASTEAPLWASSISFIFIVWRFLFEKFNVYKLSPKITPIFGLMFFAIVYLQYKTIFGQEESLTILVGLTAITILNYSTQRDHLFMVLLGFLMLVLKSVFSIDFIWTAPALISFFGLWLSLLTNAQIKRFQYVLKTFLRGIPLLVLLFLIFPRIVIFQTEQIKKMAQVQSGFTEDLTPGRFSQIALSDQMAFRAEFVNLPSVSSEKLYWRGAVLTQSNGFIWTKRSEKQKNSYVANIEDDSSIEYRIIIEPSGFRNAFVLERPIRIKTSTEPILEREYSTFIMASNPQQMVQYIGYSEFGDVPEANDDPISDPKYVKYLELPPKTTAWVNEIKSQYSSQEERLRQLTQFFEEPGFEYTLSPGAYDNMDQFLFERKKGFCEHYAAAFGSMARALGIPTRVVIGYQGGSFNAIGNFWKISQKDAHAWVEVGFDGKWKRIDPTGLVTPLRISIGSEQYFSLTDTERALYSKDKNFNIEKSYRGVYLTVTSFFESLNYAWTMFLLNYDLQTQLEILKSFKGVWFYYIFIILGAALAFWYWYKNRIKNKNSKHAFYHLILEIESWAKKQGQPVQASTPPLQMLSDLSRRYPQFQDFNRSLTRDYEIAVYREKKAEKTSDEYRKEFKRLVQNLDKRST